MEVLMEQPATRLRTDLEPLPDKMKHLPVDVRGYPVPWFVDYVDGKPEFRAMDMDKWRLAVRDRRCWVCGGQLGVWVAFVAGPMCGVNRTSQEPPSHLDCARWSARNCPFLANPDMVRRQDDLVDNDKLRAISPGVCLTRNPGVAMVWVTRSFEIFRAGGQLGNAGLLIELGEPTKVEWYTKGRAATRAEVIESIESGGYPNLVKIAQTEPGALVELQRARERFWQYLPGE